MMWSGVDVKGEGVDLRRVGAWRGWTLGKLYFLGVWSFRGRCS